MRRSFPEPLLRTSSPSPPTNVDGRLSVEVTLSFESPASTRIELIWEIAQLTCWGTSVARVQPAPAVSEETPVSTSLTNVPNNDWTTLSVTLLACPGGGS